MSEPGEFVENRTPPNDMDAEGAVLSAVMIDPDAYPAVGDFLKPEHFYSEAHRRIFEACASLTASCGPIDVVQVGGWLMDRDRLAQIGGMAYLTEVLNTAPAVGNVRAYGARVHTLWRMRQVILTAQRVTSQGYAGVTDAQAFCEQTAEVFHEYAFAPGLTSGLEPAAGTLRKMLAKVEAAQKSGKGMLGIPTGITRYDRRTGGLHDGDQTVVAARPGQGKTSWLCGTLINVAETTGPVALFSLEMPRDQIVLRMACSEAAVDFNKVRNGTLNDADWARLTKAEAYLAGLPIFIDDTPSMTVVGIRAKLRRLQLDIERGRSPVPLNPKHEKRIRMVGIDYLQLMKGTALAARQGVEREVAECSAGCKAVAKEFHVPVWLLSQMNRDIENSDRRPKMRDLRSSGAIEQDADNIVFIHPHSKKDRKIKELIIEKQRNGAPAICCVYFDGEHTRFCNLNEAEYADFEDDGPPPDEDSGPLAAPHTTGCRCPACEVVRKAREATA